MSGGSVAERDVAVNFARPKRFDEVNTVPRR